MLKATWWLAATALLVPAAALAQDDDAGTLTYDQDSDGSFAVQLGTDTAFDGNPASIRISATGEGDLFGGDIAALGVAVPVTFMTAGRDSFGFWGGQSVLEIPPSLRLRLLSSLPVRPYGDLGIGVAVAARSADAWLLQDHEHAVGWMTRSALGVELGPPDGFMVVVEPVSWQTYHVGGHYGRVSASVGIGSRF